MLSMLRFCRVVKCRSVWPVDAVRRLGIESTSRSLEHVLFLCGWKARLSNQRRSGRGRLTPRGSNKNDGRFDSNVFVFRLPLLPKVQAKCDDSEKKQVILAVGA